MDTTFLLAVAGN